MSFFINLFFNKDTEENRYTLCASKVFQLRSMMSYIDDFKNNFSNLYSTAILREAKEKAVDATELYKRIDEFIKRTYTKSDSIVLHNLIGAFKFNYDFIKSYTDGVLNK